jgi:hypothetical protein
MIPRLDRRFEVSPETLAHESRVMTAPPGPVRLRVNPVELRSAPSDESCRGLPSVSTTGQTQARRSP